MLSVTNNNFILNGFVLSVYPDIIGLVFIWTYRS